MNGYYKKNGKNLQNYLAQVTVNKNDILKGQ